MGGSEVANFLKPCLLISVLKGQLLLSQLTISHTFEGKDKCGLPKKGMLPTSTWIWKFPESRMSRVYRVYQSMSDRCKFVQTLARMDLEPVRSFIISFFHFRRDTPSSLYSS